MSISPKVFIVILNWNGKDRLAACLRSVFALSYQNFEVVVVDNASRDGSLEEAKSSFSRAHFILNSENIGFAAGMNVGIRFSLSRGAEFVWILNNDVECDRDTLSILVAAACSHGKLALYSPKILTSAGSEWFAGGIIDYVRMKTVHVDYSGLERRDIPYPTGYLCGCAMLISKKVIETVGLFDEKYFLYYEDADYSVRAARKGADLLVVPQASLVHAESSAENPEKSYWLVRSGLKFFNSHTPSILRPWMAFYMVLRRTKNGFDMLRGKKEAFPVSSAYADYRTA
ncbi:MAG: glycosyltransferase [Candidatus Moranbacteria bacterium]|nr:glycosyltransferase [Candidatus Moranbacteria bacterium]NTW75344.1 glycosyltransferase [Candidatus Moranbacteria bacterium]